MLKSQIRKQMLDARENLSAEAFAFFCASIFEGFKKLDLAGVRYLHLFLPIESKKEVDTWPIVRWLQTEHPEICLVVPRLQPGSLELLHLELLPDAEIVLNKWGIPEPVNGRLIDPLLVDLCLVPLLAADLSGHRAGYGGGFYDRFIARCRPDLRTVGLSLFEPLEELIVTDEYDRPLGSCIFPSGIKVFGKG